MNNELSKKITFKYLVKNIFYALLLKKEAIQEIAENKRLNASAVTFHVLATTLMAWWSIRSYLALGGASLDNYRLGLACLFCVFILLVDLLLVHLIATKLFYGKNTFMAFFRVVSHTFPLFAIVSTLISLVITFPLHYLFPDTPFFPLYLSLTITLILLVIFFGKVIKEVYHVKVGLAIAIIILGFISVSILNKTLPQTLKLLF